MKFKQLEGQRALIFIENLFDDLELLYPRYRLIEEGMEVVIAGPKAKEVYQSKHGYPCQADIAFQDARADDFDVLIIPGGYAPDKIRRSASAIDLVRQLNHKGKILAFICHAGSVLISADVIKGVKCTSFLSIKDDMLLAGAKWIDEAVVVDRNFISSRTPEDLPYFCPEIIEALVHARQHAPT